MTRAAGAGPGVATAGAATPAVKSASGGEKAGDGVLFDYLDHSHRPLTSLAFVLPMLLFYEFATGLWGHYPVERAPAPIVAFTLMQEFFRWFGATGRYLPALAVVGILLASHVAQKDGWRVRISHLSGMAIESLLLSIPLIAFGSLLGYLAPHRLLAGLQEETSRNLVAICFGAGVYEELVFRLILMSALSLLVKDLFGVGHKRSCLLIVLAAGILFSAYHYLGQERFNLHTFLFRTVAGVYFGALFVFRGFGVTAGCHTAYDLLYAFRLL
jgi:membrane protease YdiL (CAAX protease family)